MALNRKWEKTIEPSEKQERKVFENSRKSLISSYYVVFSSAAHFRMSFSFCENILLVNILIVFSLFII